MRKWATPTSSKSAVYRKIIGPPIGLFVRCPDEPEALANEAQSPTVLY
jgi:hypothetical protein